MDTSECPANMCEHSLDDHEATGPWGSPVMCNAPDCQCGKVVIDQETWDRAIKNSQTWDEFLERFKH